MVAVKTDTKIIEANIQNKATKRPPRVFGCLSPYPTVVMVTAENQNPERNSFDGCAAKLFWIMFPFQMPHSQANQE